MRFCQKCKEWVSGERIICPKCGSPITSSVESSSADETPVAQRKSRLDWSILLAITLNILLFFTPWILMWFVFVPSFIFCVLAIYRGYRKSGVALLVICVLIYGLSRQFSPFSRFASGFKENSRSVAPSSRFQVPYSTKSNDLKKKGIAAPEKAEKKKHDVSLIDWEEFYDFENDSGKFFKPKYGKWFLVLFEVRNNGDKPLNDFSWKKQLSDSDAKKYDSDNAFEVTYSIKKRLEETYPEIDPTNLNPGCTGKYLVLFDIPKTVAPANFIFIPNMFEDFEMQFPITPKK